MITEDPDLLGTKSQKGRSRFSVCPHDQPLLAEEPAPELRGFTSVGQLQTSIGPDLLQAVHTSLEFPVLSVIACLDPV